MEAEPHHIRSTLDSLTSALWWVVPTAVFLLSNIFLPTAYTLDDVVMAMHAQGVGIADAPHSYLYYSNYILGSAISHLYAALPFIPWYWVWLLCLHLTADLTISYVLLKPWRSLYIMASLFSYFLFVSLPFYTAVSFTATAVLAQLGAVLLALQRLQHGFLSGRALFVIGFLTVGASLTRFQAGALITALALPLLVLLGVPALSTRFRLSATPAGRAFLRICVLAYLCPILLHLLSQTLYSRQHWGEFLEFNRNKRLLLDYNRVLTSPRLDSKLVQIQWDAVDLSTMREWILFDRDTYNNRTLGLLIAPVRLPSLETLTRLARRIWGMLGQRILLTIAAISVLYLAISVAPVLAASIVLGGVGVTSILLFYYQRLTVPLFLPFCAALALLPLVVFNRRISDVAGGLVCGVFVLLLPCSVQQVRANAADMEERSGYARRLLNGLPRGKNLVLADQAPLSALNPAENLRPIVGIRIFLLGTDSQTPTTEAMLKKLGINNYYGLLLANDSFVYSDRARLLLLQKLIERREKIPVRIEYADESHRLARFRGGARS